MRAHTALKQRKYSIGVLFTDEEWERINRFIERTGLKKQFFFGEAIINELDRQEREDE